jgi:hypothetical protein
MSTLKQNLIVGVISAIVGAGLGGIISLYLSKDDVERYKKMYEVERRQVEVQIEQKEILIKGFYDLKHTLEKNNSLNPEIRKQVKDLSKNIDSIASIGKVIIVFVKDSEGNPVKNAKVMVPELSQNEYYTAADGSTSFSVNTNNKTFINFVYSHPNIANGATQNMSVSIKSLPVNLKF